MASSQRLFQSDYSVSSSSGSSSPSSPIYINTSAKSKSQPHQTIPSPILVSPTTRISPLSGLSHGHSHGHSRVHWSPTGYSGGGSRLREDSAPVFSAGSSSESSSTSIISGPSMSPADLSPKPSLFYKLQMTTSQQQPSQRPRQNQQQQQQQTRLQQQPDYFSQDHHNHPLSFDEEQVTTPSSSTSPLGSVESVQSATAALGKLSMGDPSADAKASVHQRKGTHSRVTGSTSGIPSPLTVEAARAAGARSRSSSAPALPSLPSTPSKARPGLPATDGLPGEIVTEGLDSFEGYVQGGIAHETQASVHNYSGERGLHHLRQAASLFGSAVALNPRHSWAVLRRAAVLLQLSRHPGVQLNDSIAYLRDARAILTLLASVTPHSNSTREALAAVCSRLSRLLYSHDDHADDPEEVWDGPVGQYACEALDALEEVAAERMDRARALRREAFEADAPAMADMFLTLAHAADVVAELAVDAETVEAHAELAEHSLDQAANMATLAANAPSSDSIAASMLVTKVQLTSAASATERLRHMFFLGIPLDDDDFRLLIEDIAVVVAETRLRAGNLKGSRKAAAATQAYQAVRQLAQTKVVYANLLRSVWRGWARESREPATPVNTNFFSAALSGRNTEVPQSPTGQPPLPGRTPTEAYVFGGLLPSLSPPAVKRAETSPILDRSGRTSSMSSSVSAGSLESLSIPEETEDEVAVSEGRDSFRGTSSTKLAPRRAPPPPPLTLLHDNRRSYYSPPLPVPALSHSLPAFSPLTPRTPLSPLNPLASGNDGNGNGHRRAALARRASDFPSARPNMLRSGLTPLTATCPGWQKTPPTGPSSYAAGNSNGSLISPYGGVYAAPSPRRRISGMSSPLAGPAPISAWERRPSILRLPSQAYASGISPEAPIAVNAESARELADTAWSQLGSATKNFKTALSHLSTSDYSDLDRTRLKAETLLGIANCMLFRALLVSRVRSSTLRHTARGSRSGAMSPKETALSIMAQAEVYAIWAAREVGWSFLIEGTHAAALADRRTGSWEADEAGKRAVLVTLRIWWYRATADDEGVGSSGSSGAGSADSGAASSTSSTSATPAPRATSQSNTLSVPPPESTAGHTPPRHRRATAEEHAFDKATARANVDTVLRRLKDREGLTPGDISRFVAFVDQTEGNSDPAEQLFWRSVRDGLREEGGGGVGVGGVDVAVEG